MLLLLTLLHVTSPVVLDAAKFITSPFGTDVATCKGYVIDVATCNISPAVLDAATCNITKRNICRVVIDVAT